ncbi:hypothetical protein ACKFKF_33825 [Phormidesmis sp. 146-12]
MECSPNEGLSSVFQSISLAKLQKIKLLSGFFKGFPMTPGFQQIRRKESEAGLPISERVIMQCIVAPP